MNAIELLKADHEELKKTMTEIENTSNRSLVKRHRLFAEAKLSASIHEKAEEKYLYPYLLAEKADKLDALEHKEEVKIMSRLLKELSGENLSPDEWMAKFIVLKELTDHHIKEEEDEYFPKLSKILSEDELNEIGLKIAAFMNKQFQNSEE